VILGLLIGAGVLLVLAGVVPVVREQKKLQQAVLRLHETRLLSLDPARLQGAIARIERDLAAMAALLRRS
jgi:hypothetical protein